MTLIEFLLARIAEDEADACPCCDFGPGTTSYHLRLECEAKRLRVELLVKMEGADNPMVSSHGYHLLCIEALPYADHSDFNDDWRLRAADTGARYDLDDVITELGIEEDA